MRKLLIILASACSILSARAQSVVSGTAEDINAIKMKQDRYVFAENTDKSESMAVENAKTLLADQISSWSDSNKGKKIPSLKDAGIIVAKRGPYFRAFAYVDTDASAKPEVKATAPVREAVQQEVQKVEEKVTEVPVVVEVSEDAPMPEKEAGGSSLMEITRFDQIKAYIDSLEEDGLLIDYGKFATLPKSGDCFIVIYDRTGAIKARLKREPKGIMNLETGSRDDPTNYPGCGALWFRTFNSRLK